MTLTNPFTVTTTITTTVYPDLVRAGRQDSMVHTCDVTTDDNVEIPDNLVYGVAQAACEATMEYLMDRGIGVEGEIVDDEPAPGRCPEGNMYRYHPPRPCGAYCDVVEDVIDVESEEVPA